MSQTLPGRTPGDTTAVVDAQRWPDVVTLPAGEFRARVARSLFERVVNRLEVRVLLPDGRVMGRGGLTGPVMRLVRPESFYRRVGAGGLIGFGEAYMAGD